MKYNFTVEQGATFVKQVRLIDATTGLARDLTNWTGRGQMRLNFSDVTPLATFTITLGGVLGTLNIELPSDVTTAFDFDKAVYDVELQENGTNPPNIERVLQGNVYLSPEVTK